jgi:hypothetical protein
LTRRGASVNAHELLVVLPLQAHFANDIAGAVPAVGILHLLGAYFPDIAADVRHESPARIAATMDHEHFQHRHVRAMRLDERDIRWAGFGLDDDRLEMRQAAGFAYLLVQFIERKVHALGDLWQEAFDNVGIIA